MIRRITILLILILGIFVVSAYPEDRCEMSVQEHEVISAVILEYFNPRDELLVICSETMDVLLGISNFQMPSSSGVIQKSAVESCIQRNQCVAHLRRRLCLPCRYVLLSRDDFNTIWGDLVSFLADDWDGMTCMDRFERAFPGARNFIEFSRVGINENENEAFVFMQYTFGDMAGAGYYFYLEKKDSVWAVKNSVNCISW